MKFLVLAMGRTGHHAVIKWISDGLDGLCEMHNNCKNGWGEKKFIPMKKICDTSYPVHTIKNIEDFYLPLWNEKKMEDWEKFDKVILVVRSPSNWLASSIAAGGWAKDYLLVAPSCEPELPVSRITAYKKYFTYEIKIGYFIMVKYDNLLISDSYRKNLAEYIGIKDTSMPKHCKFSSFGKNHDYTGNRYGLLNKNQKRLFDSLWDYELQEILDEEF